MKYFIDEAKEKEIARAVDTVDVSTPRQRNAVVLRTVGKPSVVIISNYPNARGYCYEAGDVVDGFGVVIYAPSPFDLPDEIKRAYPSEYDADDALFMYTEKYHDLKIRYLKEFRQRADVQKIIRRALDDCVFTVDATASTAEGRRKKHAKTTRTAAKRLA